MGLLGQICKKTGAGRTIPCKSRTHQSKELRTRSTACELFRADYLIKSETKNPYIRHEIYMEKNPEINSDRVHLTYRIKTNTIYDTLKSERPLGCRRSRCYTEGIKIVEYKMDCLSLEYQDIRKWEFSFDTYPNQIHGGYPSIQSGLYFGEEKTSIKSWSKIEQNSIHKVIAGALCKIVLPLRNSEK